MTGLSPETRYQFRIVLDSATGGTQSGLLEQETPAAVLETKLSGTASESPEQSGGSQRRSVEAGGDNAGCAVEVTVAFLDEDGTAVAVDALAASDFTAENGRVGTPVADADGLGWTVPVRATTNERGFMRVRLPATERWRAAEQVFHIYGASVCAPAARWELADLLVDDLGISPGFNSTTTSYTSETVDADATVEAEAVYADATVTIAPADADEDTDGHQVTLPV